MPIGREGPVWEREVWRAATSIDPRATVRVAVPLSEEAARLWASPRFMAVLIAALAAVSMLLAIVGIYGVSAFSMEHRARDIAIRWALGATGAAMARSLLAESAAVLAIGTAGGVGGAVLIGRVLATQLHGVQAVDLWTLAGGAVLVTVLAGAAAALPAMRAALSDHLSLLSEM